MTLPRILVALAITLAVALIVAQLSEPVDMGRNIALLIGTAMTAVLVGPSIIGHFGNNIGTGLRYALIWAGLLALVALAYSYKASFEF